MILAWFHLYSFILLTYTPDFCQSCLMFYVPADLHTRACATPIICVLREPRSLTSVSSGRTPNANWTLNGCLKNVCCIQVSGKFAEEPTLAVLYVT